MFKSLFSRSQCWALHNPLKSWTLKDLTDRELRQVVNTLTKAEFQLCLVWKKGWSQWTRLSSLEGFEIQSHEEPLIIEGAPPIPGHGVESTEAEITQVKIVSRGPARHLQDRRHGRHEISIPVEIIQGSQTFRTETLDVSYSGVRFKEPIPDWVAGYFTVLFRLPNQTFEITCALVEDQKDSKNCAEVFDTNDEESGLKTFITWVNSLDL